MALGILPKSFGTSEKQSKARGPFLESPETFGRISGDIILFVSSKRRRLEPRNFAVIFILFRLQHIKRPALQNKQVVVLRMAFRARKVLGTFEKRPPGPTEGEIKRESRNRTNHLLTMD